MYILHQKKRNFSPHAAGRGGRRRPRDLCGVRKGAIMKKGRFTKNCPLENQYLVLRMTVVFPP